MSLHLPLTLMAVAALQQQTDTTVTVAANARLELTNHAGEIVVSAWDRNAMRVRAEHGSRDRIDVETRGSVITLRASRRYGRPAVVDYHLTVPTGMALKLSGTHAEIDITGVRGDIRAESVEGDITVRQIGSATLGSVEGDIRVTGANGALRIHAIDGDIHLIDVTGDITVENIDGDVTLDGVESSNVDVSTVDGELLYRGVVRDGGRYRLTSHDGDVILAVPAGINATISVATFDGDFEADPAFRVQVRDARPGRRFSFVLGSGSAQVELESFDGSIRLVRR